MISPLTTASSKRINRKAFLRTIGGAAAGSILSNCTSIGVSGTPRYQAFQDVPSREYLAWAGVRPGTTKTFNGSSVFGGKQFMLGLKQELMGVKSSSITLRISYSVDGIQSKKSVIHVIPARGKADPSGMSALTASMQISGLGVLPAPSPPNRPQVLLDGPSLLLKEKDTYRWTMTFRPQSKTFSLQGSSYPCDCYQAISLSTENQQDAWRYTAHFCDAVPGGWVSAQVRGDQTGFGVEADRITFSVTHDIRSLFYLGASTSLLLTSFG
ncbi:MAG: hypothetical protein ACO1TE_12555 [Prosthecobacter sp.]